MPIRMVVPVRTFLAYELLLGIRAPCCSLVVQMHSVRNVSGGLLPAE